MVFIAFDSDNNVMSIVNAKSKELAVVFWQGKDIQPSIIRCVEKDFISLDKHATGIYEIVKFTKISGVDLHEYTEIQRSGRDKNFYFGKFKLV